MDGVFMGKRGKYLFWGLLIVSMFFSAELATEKLQLRKNMIRFHVVANSDSVRDQSLKLLVRDAVINSIRQDMQYLENADSAKLYIQSHISSIQQTANETLAEAGASQRAVVTLCEESFPVRVYDTFILPSGVYESLRITIGEGKGHNWWCVAFPDLCMPATSEDFAEVALEAGFTQGITETISHPENRKIHFFCLDVIGKLENILWASE